MRKTELLLRILFKKTEYNVQSLGLQQLESAAGLKVV